MLKINKDNYEYYKLIFSIIWEFQAECAKIDKNAEYSPINVLNSWEKESTSKAQKGLKEGLNDFLIGIKDLPQNYLEILNSKLSEKELPKIEKLIAYFKNIPQKVLKKGKISNLNEYYIIKEVIDDVNFNISDTQKNELNKIFLDFESNYKKRKNIS